VDDNVKGRIVPNFVDTVEVEALTGIIAVRSPKHPSPELLTYQPEPESFKVYPNPYTPGTALNIKWKEVEEGPHQILLSGQSGKSLWQQDTWISEKVMDTQINIPLLTAGIYFITVTNKRSKRKFTQKIIVQP
jgi:hypothetical protein